MTIFSFQKLFVAIFILTLVTTLPAFGYERGYGGNSSGYVGSGGGYSSGGGSSYNSDNLYDTPSYMNDLLNEYKRNIRSKRANPYNYNNSFGRGYPVYSDPDFRSGDEWGSSRSDFDTTGRGTPSDNYYSPPSTSRSREEEYYRTIRAIQEGQRGEWEIPMNGSGPYPDNCSGQSLDPTEDGYCDLRRY